MKAILKQTSWLFFAQIITRIFGFFYTIFLARSLGVEVFGLFSTGLAYFSIFSSFMDFGFNRFLVREIAKEEGKSWELIWNVLMLRLTFVSILFAIFAVFIYLFDQDKTRVSVILLSILAVLPQAIAITFDGVFVAFRQLQFSAISAFISSIGTIFIGFLLVSRGFGVFGAINALIFGQLIYAFVLFCLIYKRKGFRIVSVTVAVIKKSILGSLPYGLLAILGLLYFKIDTVMLAYMRGNFDTGIYSAGYRFLESLIFIPNALSLALFPVFAKLHEEKSSLMKVMIYKNIKIMFFLGILMTILYLLLLPVIIKIFLPNFSSAIQVIQILSLAIPFIFIYVPLTTVLTSTEKYLKQVIFLSISTVTFNIVANLIFIPKFGYLAAAWITVASDVLSLVLIISFIQLKIFKNS